MSSRMLTRRSRKTKTASRNRRPRSASQSNVTLGLMLTENLMMVAANLQLLAQIKHLMAKDQVKILKMEREITPPTAAKK